MVAWSLPVCALSLMAAGRGSSVRASSPSWMRTTLHGFQLMAGITALGMIQPCRWAYCAWSTAASRKRVLGVGLGVERIRLARVT